MTTPHEKEFADIEALIGAALDRAVDLHKLAEDNPSDPRADATRAEAQRWNKLAVDAAFGLIALKENSPPGNEIDGDTKQKRGGG